MQKVFTNLYVVCNGLTVLSGHSADSAREVADLKSEASGATDGLEPPGASRPEDQTKSAVLRSLKELKFGGPQIDTKQLFVILFGRAPQHTEQEQLIKTMAELNRQEKFSAETKEFFVMFSGEPKSVSFKDTKIGQQIFAAPGITEEKVEHFRGLVKDLQLALCELGAEYIIRYAPSEKELGRRPTALDMKIFDQFWENVLSIDHEHERFARLLDMSPRTLTGVAAYRLRNIKFQYVAREFYGQLESELEKITVCSGNYNTKRLIQTLFGEKVDITPNDSYHMTKAALDTRRKATNHPCWADLLEMEFGVGETDAASLCSRTDAILNSPLTALQHKLSEALMEIATNFIQITDERRTPENS